MGVSKQSLACAALASVVVASPAPQQLDFAVIEAAPSVATGPESDAVASQTAALYTSFTISGPAVASSGTAAIRARQAASFISSDQTDSTYNAALGKQGQTTTVNSGVTYWLNGGSTHNFYGNIKNYGRIFASQTAYLKTNKYAGGQTSDWVGHDASNGNLVNAAGATIQLNDIGSASAPTYDWHLRQMNNDGIVQWCGRGDTGGSTYQMYSDLDSTNNGLISFEQSFDNKGASFVWRNPTLTTSNRGANIYNNGAFRLINVNYQNVQNVYGTGCWQLGKGAILYLQDGTGVFQNPTAGPSFPNQSISFQDASAVLHMDTAVYSKSADFGAQIYGFGSGNAIEFYERIQTFNYAPATGVLSVTMTSKNYVNIKLGKGYIASKFVNDRNPEKYNVAGYNAIFYNGMPPAQSAPPQCSSSAPICSDLSGGLPPAVFSSSSSASRITASATSTGSVDTTGRSSTSVLSATDGLSTTSASSPTISASSSIFLTSSRSSPSSTTVLATGLSASSTVSATRVTASSAVSSSTTLMTAAPTTVAGSCGAVTTSSKPYTPYYPALSTTLTTDAALTGTTTAGQACPTTPEDGTYCGFINPEDPCAPQPDGYGHVPTPDTASAFLAFSSLHALASAAPTTVSDAECNQYTQVFKDLDGSISANSYLGLYTLDSYDVNACAAKCDAHDLCTSFNIYAERDPSLNPSKNDSTAFTVYGYWCPNPASMTSFKCTLWGSSIDSSLATNQGEWREDFEVVITASTGYDKTNVTVPHDPTAPVDTPVASDIATSSLASSMGSTVTSITTSGSSGSLTSSMGSTISSTLSNVASASTTSSVSTSTPSKPWKAAHNCNGKAINASQYWLGSRFFPGPYNPQVCSDYALAQNAANQRSAQTAGRSSYSKCQMFNAYYLHKNDVPHGTYCSLYNQALPDSWATYSGGKSGKDTYKCKQSWTWTLA